MSEWSEPTSQFLRHSGAQLPVVCGAMYPCSNPELVAAVSQAGGIGIIQPLSLVYVHGYGFAEGLEKIRSLTDKPVGMNILVEKSVKAYERRMREYIEVALAAGVRFFVTALGNPKWVVDRVKAEHGFVYHDVTERKWALRALEHGVDGLICVNRDAGGHAGQLSPKKLLEQLSDLGVPLICAGGIGDERAIASALAEGYAGVQLGTRFIASQECRAHQDYKQAIVAAKAKDIVLTEKLTGVPVAVINTPYIQRLGTKAGFVARWMLKGRKTKHWMRMIYSLKSVWQLKKSLHQGKGYRDYFQAGKSVQAIDSVRPVSDIMSDIRRELTGT